VHIDAIFATADSTASQRPQLTVTPLANALGLTVNTHYETNKLPNWQINCAQCSRKNACSFAGITAKFPTCFERWSKSRDTSEKG